MNKQEMVAKLAEKAQMTKADAQKALDGVVKIISDELKDGGKVILTGFGSFSVTERKARTGRNPQNGEPINIPASRVPKFKAGKNLKELFD
ncbi:MAG: HU family DNA-binding protein [Desulfonatronovibrio sp. MSAO_Bac4]|nr:MAG: HU family DNA-binding protein [Desulfonatronovibrio sp. MSAO_Bac4]